MVVGIASASLLVAARIPMSFAGDRAPYSFVWATGRLMPGTWHTLKAIAYDDANRQIGQASSTVMVTR